MSLVPLSATEKEIKDVCSKREKASEDCSDAKLIHTDARAYQAEAAADQACAETELARATAWLETVEVDAAKCGPQTLAQRAYVCAHVCAPPRQAWPPCICTRTGAPPPPQKSNCKLMEQVDALKADLADTEAKTEELTCAERRAVLWQRL